MLKSPGGKSVLDEEIERNERREYHEGYFGESESYGVRAHEDGDASPSQSPSRNGKMIPHESPVQSPQNEGAASHRSMSPPPLAPNPLSFGEMFVFSYGVVVFWNFTERQEKDILADLTFSQSINRVPLVTRPQREEDFETEEFHFEYNPNIPRPRVYNDMITLRSSDHMIKLAISHAIAQSTKLCFFEERMAHIMLEAQYVPRRLALTGKLGMKREDVVKILGRLFSSRVDVNLCKCCRTYPKAAIRGCHSNLGPLQRQICSTSPTSFGTLNPRCTPFMPQCASTSKSNRASRSSTSGVASSSTWPKYSATRSQTKR